MGEQADALLEKSDELLNKLEVATGKTRELLIWEAVQCLENKYTEEEVSDEN